MPSDEREDGTVKRGARVAWRMLKRPFGWTGVEVPVIGQGSWQLRDKRAAADAIREGISLGMTHIDTAELYRGSEEVLSPIVHEFRERLFLVSKVMPNHASFDGTLKACDASLARLGTDHLDMYLQHWNDGTHPIEETMRALAELVDMGRTRFVGVSNFDVEELEVAKSALGKHRIASNQVLYHLGERGIESEVLPWCKENGVALVGYSSYGSGNFPSPESPGGRVLAEVATRVGKTPRQVALAFLTRDPHVFVIPKAESIPHVRENAGGAFVLPDDEIARIDAAFPARPGLRFL